MWRKVLHLLRHRGRVGRSVLGPSGVVEYGGEECDSNDHSAQAYGKKVQWGKRNRASLNLRAARSNASITCCDRAEIRCTSGDMPNSIDSV